MFDTKYDVIQKNNIIGIGCDIVDINRMHRIHAYSDALSRKILSVTELNIMRSKASIETQSRYLAKRWCAKEAVFKAIPLAKKFLINAKYIEILNDSQGKPYVNLLYNIDQLLLCNFDQYQIHISISDEINTAIAFCIICK